MISGIGGALVKHLIGLKLRKHICNQKRNIYKMSEIDKKNVRLAFMFL